MVVWLSQQELLTGCTHKWKFHNGNIKVQSIHFVYLWFFFFLFQINLNIYSQHNYNLWNMFWNDNIFIFLEKLESVSIWIKQMFSLLKPTQKPSFGLIFLNFVIQMTPIIWISFGLHFSNNISISRKVIQFLNPSLFFYLK